MKTSILNIYLNNLANLNDQFCFYLFNREELNQKLKNFSVNTKDLFTTDLFSQNQYAPKIHVTIEKIPQFQSEHQTLNFGAYFSFSYELASSYLEDLIELISKINSSTYVGNSKREPELRFKKVLSDSGYGLPQIELIETLSYCRLRRNYFTHVLDTMNNKFLDIVNNRGISLNTFWNNSISNLDFTDKNVDEFKESETFELIKLLRIIVQELDTYVANLLNPVGISEYISHQTYDKNKSRINEDVVKQRKSKVRSLGKQLFGITLSDIDMDNAVRTIGIK